MNEMISVTYKLRESVMKQIDLLYKDVPDNIRVGLYQDILALESKEREEIKRLKENMVGEKEVLEELSLMSSYTNKYDTLIKEHFNIYRDQNAVYSEDGLPKDVIK